MCLSCTIFEIQRVCCISKMAQDRNLQIFPIPHVHGAQLGVDPLEFHENLWKKKSKVTSVAYHAILFG